MIENKILRLKQDASLNGGYEFKAGQEFVVVTDVVYMGGHPVPPNSQGVLLNWIKENLKMFNDVTQQYK